MRITTLTQALKYSGRAGGVSAAELSELTGASLRESRDTLREMLHASAVDRRAHTYHFNENSYLADTVLSAVEAKRKARLNG